ncbi:MAG: hypothetical protein ABSG15_04530 [FCB group bacterium]
MKIIIISLAAVLFGMTILAQEKSSIQHKIYTFKDDSYSNKDSIYINSDSTRFKLNPFTRTFQWGNGLFMAKTLNLNSNHTQADSIHRFPAQYRDTTDFILGIYGLSTNREGLAILQSAGIEYKPALLIDTNKIPYLQYRTGDTTRAVFGFKTVIGEPLENNPSNPDFQYLSLKKNGSYVSNIIPVLEGNWVNDVLYTNIVSDTVINNNYIYRGYKWRLCVNLKRGDSTDNTQNSDTVLVITLPYRRHNDIDSIKFSYIPPSNSYNKEGISNAGYFRGYRLIPTDSAYNTKQFIIRNNMLPKYDTNITLMAEFFTDNELQNHNAMLGGDTNGYNIIELNIKVYYYGNLDVKLNTIRIATPNCDTLLWGYSDSDIVSKVQNEFNYWDSSIYVNNRKILKRIYTRDEHNPSFWISMKYFHDLIGNIGTTEAGQTLSDIYSYYVNVPEFWANTGYPNDAGVTPPYIPITDTMSYRCMGYPFGYKYLNHYPNLSDTLKSDYETWLIWGYNYFIPQEHQTLRWLLDTADFKDYIEVISASRGYQAWF